jgi:hypothetical protein
VLIIEKLEKYFKLYCDRHHCNTEFLVAKQKDRTPEYFICPVCEGLVFIDDESEENQN